MNFKNTRFKKTKIIATMGPTFSTYEESVKMFKAGVNVVRLNTSHGVVEDHAPRLKAAKKAAKDLNLPITFMLDTKGPEIRIGKIDGKLKVDSGDELILDPGKEFISNSNTI